MQIDIHTYRYSYKVKFQGIYIKNTKNKKFYIDIS